MLLASPSFLRVHEEVGDVFNPRSKLKNKKWQDRTKNKIRTDKNAKGEDETWFQIVTENGRKHRNQNMAVGRNRFHPLHPVHPFNFGVDLSEYTSQL